MGINKKNLWIRMKGFSELRSTKVLEVILLLGVVKESEEILCCTTFLCMLKVLEIKHQLFISTFPQNKKFYHLKRSYRLFL